MKFIFIFLAVCLNIILYKCCLAEEDTVLRTYGIDKAVKTTFQNARKPFLDELSSIFENIGDGKFILAGWLTTYIYSNGAENSYLKETAKLGLISLITVGLTVNIIKYAMHRVRPNKTDSPYVWHGPSLKHEDVSFPSGHTAAAFSAATVIATRYPNILTSLISYTLATGVALSRIYTNVHWGTDVIAGAVIGYIGAKVVCNLFSKKSSYSLLFTPNNKNFYLILSAKF